MIEIRKLRIEDGDGWKGIDDRFTIDSALVLSMTDGEISYTVQEIPSYVKSYAETAIEEATDEEDSADYIDNPAQVMYVAYAGNQTVGRILLKRNWNRYALIEDIAVDANRRGGGIGRRLVEQAIQWARDGGMPGVMLETQNHNVGACRLYESCGFVIGGFDTRVYRGLHKDRTEVAIYWYLVFD
ncbi:GNAT family N-acetyltransferase [Paenibacillus sp. 1011MAR3C5]|uniref:GNAT family N-acetyltransferase n=1 Tax=Paenibacillus sp. 1011MAR3C5 TaxID=1675787 RepID=UPI000E6BE25D|nr:GNAT family N-acetyltransferase [Paenibacillus sp. 1011MAR3C5]RJE88402.1 GNAT family N-acetyltransferase [Paenibacillus sp. 1011MAR3C5]